MYRIWKLETMASAFKNAGMTVVTTDTSLLIYIQHTSNGQALFMFIHLKQKPTNYGNVDVKVTTDGGSTFHHVAKSVQIELRKYFNP